jgi:hypothetical protein
MDKIAAIRLAERIEALADEEAIALVLKVVKFLEKLKARRDVPMAREPRGTRTH